MGGHKGSVLINYDHFLHLCFMWRAKLTMFTVFDKRRPFTCFPWGTKCDSCVFYGYEQCQEMCCFQCSGMCVSLCLPTAGFPKVWTIHQRTKDSISVPKILSRYTSSVRWFNGFYLSVSYRFKCLCEVNTKSCLQRSHSQWTVNMMHYVACTKHRLNLACFSFLKWGFPVFLP